MFCCGKDQRKAMVYVLKCLFLNIEDAKLLTNESINDTINLGKLTEKNYRKTRLFNVVAKNLGLGVRNSWF